MDRGCPVLSNDPAAHCHSPVTASGHTAPYTALDQLRRDVAVLASALPLVARVDARESIADVLRPGAVDGPQVATVRNRLRRHHHRSAAMASQNPVAELEPRFSSDAAAATPWSEARARLDAAEVYWLATVRPDGRPHVTPVLSVMLDGALYFCTGQDERKAKNLAHNAHCVLTTGCNALNDGLDLVVEGDAVRVGDEATLQCVAERYAAKYGWQFRVRDGALHGDHGNVAQVYAVPPTTAFGFGKGTSSQTRWRF
jgi:hypothetical protein